MPEIVRRFIGLVSRLVPAWARRDFLNEWDAELAHAWREAAGAPHDQRWRVAARAFGSIPDAWFLFCQQWSLDMLLQDLRYALRLMRQRIGYTVIVVATLAIGIGANTAMFSAIHAVLLRPLPYKDPSRLVKIWENDRLNRESRSVVAPANFEDWRTRTHSFDRMAAYVGTSATLSAPGLEAFHANIALVSTNLLETLGVGPALGRSFAASDAIPPHHRVLILSSAAWLMHFGGDARLIDRTVQLDGIDYQVVGVMPGGFAFPARTTDAWRPMVMTPQVLATRAQHFLEVIARISPAATLDRARSDLESVALSDQHAYPQTNEQRGTTMVPLQEAVVGDVSRPMYFLGAAVALLLLIACANVANLMLVQGAGRRREMAIRSALGADRFRIVRQLLIEGLLLAVLSGAAGILLASWGTRMLARLAVDYVPRVTTVRMDPTVLGFAILLSLVTGLVFAFAPAVRASHSDVQRDLRDGARGTMAGGRLVRRALVVAEFASAVVLVVGATLLLESFWHLLSVNPGFQPDHVLAVATDLPSARYSQDPPIRQFYSDLISRLSRVAGVQAVGVVNNLPLSGEGWTTWLTIENRARPAGQPPEVGYRIATPGYLAAMGIPLLKGRWIDDSDTPDSMKVIVINKALEDRFFPDGHALGQRVRLGPNPKSPWRTIVGVVGNIHHAGPETPADPEEFHPFAQDTSSGTLVVRASGDPAAIAAAVRDASRSIDPSVVLWRMQWMDNLIEDHLAPRRLSMLLVEGFAAVALGLALLGIYGVMSYAVSQRTQEIGVRVALGAEPGSIHSMVIRDGMRLAGVGLGLGAGVALFATRLARSLLFDVSPTDPLAFAASVVGVLAVALLACYLPARRAARVDPLVAMRAE
jgi:predicted permease